MQRLSDGTAVPVERIARTGLSAYTGYLWESYYPQGALGWVLPIGRFGRRRVRHGEQFCRICLAEDTQPYFRRKWRLAFNVVCERHAVFLEDACPHCDAPVAFHTGDFGQRLLDLECPITRCRVCRRNIEEMGDSPPRTAPHALVEFQRRLNTATNNGCCPDLPGAANYSHLFFTGFRQLLRVLVSRGRCRRLRDLMLGRVGQLALGVSSTQDHPVFELLRVGDRAHVLQLSAPLLEQWPQSFVELCQASRVSSSYVLQYGVEMPFWFRSEVEWHLCDSDYHPSDEEREAIAAYLVKRGCRASRNAVNFWLGKACVKPGISAQEISAWRWNPRGPRSKMTLL